MVDRERVGREARDEGDEDDAADALHRPLHCADHWPGRRQRWFVRRALQDLEQRDKRHGRGERHLEAGFEHRFRKDQNDDEGREAKTAH